MKNRFNLNESEKKRIRGLHGIVNEQFRKDEIWPFTMERWEFENRTPGGTGLPVECDECLMATIPEQYLDKDKRFGVFKAIVKFILQLSGTRYVKTGDFGTGDPDYENLGGETDMERTLYNNVGPSVVSTWEKPMIKLSHIIAILKDFSPLGIISLAKDLFKCMNNECSPTKVLPHQIILNKWDRFTDQTGKIVIINGLKFVLDKDGKILGQLEEDQPDSGLYEVLPK